SSRPSDSFAFSLHDALPIYWIFEPWHRMGPFAECTFSLIVSSVSDTRQARRGSQPEGPARGGAGAAGGVVSGAALPGVSGGAMRDRKSTRLNSSHQIISYAV